MQRDPHRPGFVRRYRGGQPRGFDGVVQKVRNNGVERRRRHCHAGGRSVFFKLDRRAAQPPRRCRDRLQPLARHQHSMPGLAIRRRQPLDERADLLHRRPDGRQHVALKLGIFEVRLGVLQQQGQLARYVLDVVRNEREPLAVFVQLPCLDQPFGGALLRHIGRHLPANDAQQVEHLAIQLELGARARHHNQPGQPAIVIERHRQPRVGNADVERLHLDDPAAVAERRHQRVFGQDRRGCRRHVPRSRPLECNIAAFAQEQHAARTIHHLGQRPDHARMQRDIGVRRRQRGDAAHPFTPVVVAMAEEMIDQQTPQPRTRRPRGQQHRDRNQPGEDQADLGHAAPLGAAEIAERLAGADQAQQENSRHHQRGAVEHRGARDMDVHAPARTIARRRHRQERRHDRRGDRAAIEQHERNPAEQQRIRRNGDVVDRQRPERDAGQVDVPARVLGRVEIEVFDQQHAAHGNPKARHHFGRPQCGGPTPGAAQQRDHHHRQHADQPHHQEHLAALRTVRHRAQVKVQDEATPDCRVQDIQGPAQQAERADPQPRDACRPQCGYQASRREQPPGQAQPAAPAQPALNQDQRGQHHIDGRAGTMQHRDRGQPAGHMSPAYRAPSWNRITRTVANRIKRSRNRLRCFT